MPKNPRDPHDLAEPHSVARLGRLGARMAVGGVATVAATFAASATVLDPVEPTAIFSVRAVVGLLATVVTLTGLGCLAAARVAARRGRTRHVGWGKIALGVALAWFLGLTALGALGGAIHTPSETEPLAPVAGTYELPCGASALTGTPEQTVTGGSALDAVELLKATGGTAVPESALGMLRTVQFPPAGLPDSRDVTLVGRDAVTGTDRAAVTITQNPDGPWTVVDYQVCPR